MLALNSKCLIGDQFEPSGVLSKPVYDLIGKVYSKVEEKEPWCANADHVAEIGVFVLQMIKAEYLISGCYRKYTKPVGISI
jgi:hypothetical protein